MRECEAGERRLEDAAALRESEVPDEWAQRAALHVLHRDPREPVVLEDIMRGDDVRVAERPGEARLADEALGEGRVGGLQARDLLERDIAVEITLASEVDDGDAAASDLSDDLVRSDGAGGLFHRTSTLGSAWSIPHPLQERGRSGPIAWVGSERAYVVPRCTRFA